ncbi:MAG: DUF5606 domain-containing protein [Muribaculaceae bacterium]|nr:DUF5606 domain-containing protein [Muribaculaceae bacterium]
MLKEILAITGKPGLYKIVSHSGKSLIVEDLTSGKRFPISPRDRVVSLGDIAMYTEEEDKPLGEILDAIYAIENGKQLNVKDIIAGEGLKGRFALYEPNFDKERVHDSDIKKLFSWYNLLVDKGFTKFSEEKPEEVKETEEPKKEDKKDSEAK